MTDQQWNSIAAELNKQTEVRGKNYDPLMAAVSEVRNGRDARRLVTKILCVIRAHDEGGEFGMLAGQMEALLDN